MMARKRRAGTKRDSDVLLEEPPPPKPPPRLFHYTTQDAFLSVVRSKQIWTSPVQFLNDSSEYKFAANLAAQELIEVSHDPPESLIRRVCDSIKENLDSLRSINFYIFSLSENGDLLSQWRAYCRTGPGYALAFDSKSLQKMAADQGRPAQSFGAIGRIFDEPEIIKALDDFCDRLGIAGPSSGGPPPRSAFNKSQGFQLVRCIYKKKDQLARVRLLIFEAFRMALLAQAKTDAIIKAIANEYAWRIAHLALILKDPGFSEEKEWRLISPPISYGDPQLDYRSGRHCILPYFKLDVGREDCAIRGAWIKPTPYDEFASSSTYTFFLAQGIERPEVYVSKLPYREV